MKNKKNGDSYAEQIHSLISRQIKRVHFNYELYPTTKKKISELTKKLEQVLAESHLSTMSCWIALDDLSKRLVELGENDRVGENMGIYDKNEKYLKEIHIELKNPKKHDPQTGPQCTGSSTK